MWESHDREWGSEEGKKKTKQNRKNKTKMGTDMVSESNREANLTRSNRGHGGFSAAAPPLPAAPGATIAILFELISRKHPDRSPKKVLGKA